MLAEDHAEDADRRRLGHGGRSHVASRRLGAARDEIDAELGHWHGFFQRVGQMEQGVDAHQRIFLLIARFRIQSSTR